MKEAIKYHPNLTLADALCIIAAKELPGAWGVFRPIDCPADLIEKMQSNPCKFIPVEGIFRSQVVMFSKDAIWAAGHGALSFQDLNADDWIVCHGSEIYGFFNEWVRHLTRNWPGDCREFISSNGGV